MGSIISIQGSMAVGKTTLAKRLEKRLNHYQVVYENPYPIVNKRNNLRIDLHTLEGFIQNQRLFIEAEINRFNRVPDSNIIFDRGPEDIEFYTLYFPIANGYSWDIENHLKKELFELRKCRSKMIVYLDAEIETIQMRKQNDLTKRRNSFNENLKLYQFEKDWFNQFNTNYFDVNDKTPDEIEELIVQLVRENNEDR
ncbi:AAA family ATPase [Gottfriedia luciferensis]|uniref:AAA family ATPase n=1 Tax=Gottfriedia luciferensis TaxID=178774 RepID=UPI000B44746F|nr:AAA family ATPase [Gottfriedia luciferensis]